MKVAVSIPDELYEQADATARRLGLNRSQLYTRAVIDFLGAQGADPVTEKLDELAVELGAVPPAVGRQLIDAGRWEW